MSSDGHFELPELKLGPTSVWERSGLRRCGNARAYEAGLEKLGPMSSLEKLVAQIPERERSERTPEASEASVPARPSGRALQP